MSDVSYYTKEGMDKLKKELNYLREKKRPEASEAIAEARDKGDLSENAEYDAAKEAQQLLETRITKMEQLVAQARVIDGSQIDDSKALIHSKVKLKNEANGKEMTYKLVAQSEANLKAGKISVDSPIGQGILGKEVGDKATIKVPKGNMTFEVLEISRDK